MGKAIDLTGQKFGRWNVIRASNARNKNGRILWECECDCSRGVTHLIPTGTLRFGSSKSCGCLQKEAAAKAMSNNFKKYNNYDLSNNYGIGYTTKGEPFYFDLEDYDKIKDYCWCITSNGYVCTNIYNENKRNQLLLMHRLIMDCVDKKIFVDHINHITNDNRKINLRLVTQSQNQMNKKTNRNNSSGVAGVYFDNHRNKWVAEIKIAEKKRPLGYFINFQDAVNARKKAEEEMFGEYSFVSSQKNSTFVNNQS